MLIDQFISYIEAEKRFSPLTVEAYRRDMEQFAGFMEKGFEVRDLTKVKTTMVKSYIVSLKEKGLVNRRQGNLEGTTGEVFSGDRFFDFRVNRVTQKPLIRQRFYVQ